MVVHTRTDCRVYLYTTPRELETGLRRCHTEVCVDHTRICTDDENEEVWFPSSLPPNIKTITFILSFPISNTFYIPMGIEKLYIETANDVIFVDRFIPPSVQFLYLRYRKPGLVRLDMYSISKFVICLDYNCKILILDKKHIPRNVKKLSIISSLQNNSVLIDAIKYGLISDTVTHLSISCNIDIRCIIDYIPKTVKHLKIRSNELISININKYSHFTSIKGYFNTYTHYSYIYNLTYNHYPIQIDEWSVQTHHFIAYRYPEVKELVYYFMLMSQRLDNLISIIPFEIMFEIFSWFTLIHVK